MLMINKRLIREVDSSMKYVGLSVLCQWGMLVLNIVLIAAIAKLLEDVILQRDIFGAQVGAAALLAVVVIWGRWLLCRLSARFSDKASPRGQAEAADAHLPQAARAGQQLS